MENESGHLSKKLSFQKRRRRRGKKRRKWLKPASLPAGLGLSRLSRLIVSGGINSAGRSEEVGGWMDSGLPESPVQNINGKLPRYHHIYVFHLINLYD